MSCCMGGFETYPRLLERTSLVKIRLFRDGCYLKDPCRNHYVICHVIEEAHELCQFGRRELSDVFIADGTPTCLLAALAPVCNHDVLI